VIGIFALIYGAELAVCKQIDGNLIFV